MTTREKAERKQLRQRRKEVAEELKARHKKKGSGIGTIFILLGIGALVLAYFSRP